MQKQEFLEMVKVYNYCLRMLEILRLEAEDTLEDQITVGNQTVSITLTRDIGANRFTAVISAPGKESLEYSSNLDEGNASDNDENANDLKNCIFGVIES